MRVTRSGAVFMSGPFDPNRKPLLTRLGVGASDLGRSDPNVCARDRVGLIDGARVVAPSARGAGLRATIKRPRRMGEIGLKSPHFVLPE